MFLLCLIGSHCYLLNFSSAVKKKEHRRKKDKETKMEGPKDRARNDRAPFSQWKPKNSAASPDSNLPENQTISTTSTKRTQVSHADETSLDADSSKKQLDGHEHITKKKKRTKLRRSLDACHSFSNASKTVRVTKISHSFHSDNLPSSNQGQSSNIFLKFNKQESDNPTHASNKTLQEKQSKRFAAATVTKVRKSTDN